MARASITDPLRNFKFRVMIDPGSSALAGAFSGTATTTPGTATTPETVSTARLNMGFSAVSGLTVSNEMIAYREGGMNTHPHKMIGQSDYGPVTFSKGVFSDQDQLYNWQQFLHSWSQGGTNSLGSSSTDNNYRCDIIVMVYDHPVSNSTYASGGTDGTATGDNSAIKLGYKLFNCWPASYALGDLNAGDSSLLIQQLVVNHEGFQILWSGSGTTTRTITPSAFAS